MSLLHFDYNLHCKKICLRPVNKSYRSFFPPRSYLCVCKVFYAFSSKLHKICLIMPTGRRGWRRRHFRDHLRVFTQRATPGPHVLPASLRRTLLRDHRQHGRRHHLRGPGGHGGLARGRPRVYSGRARAARDEDPWVPVAGGHQQHLRWGATHSTQVIALTWRGHLPPALPAPPRRESQPACCWGQR